MACKIDINKRHFYTFQLLLFTLMTFMRAYGDAMIVSNKTMPINDDFKYILLMLATLICIPYVIKHGVINNRYNRDLIRFCILIGVWAIVSVLFVYNRQAPRLESTQYWIYIILAFAYSYMIINTVNQKIIDMFFKITLLISILCYMFVEIGISEFNIANILSISYTDSYSPFESHSSSGVAISMCAYFGYYRKNNKFWLGLSILFTFLTFKRLALVMALVYAITPLIFNMDRKLSRKTVFTMGIVVIIVTLIMSIVLQHQYVAIINQKFNIDLNQFAMGRVDLYNSLLNLDYKMAGLGTSKDHLQYFYGKSYGIELELLQLLLETSIAGLSTFIWYCFSIAKRHLYCILLVLFMVFNMLTSSALASPFSWIFFYLTIWQIRNSSINKTQEVSYGEENKYNCSNI